MCVARGSNADTEKAPLSFIIRTVIRIECLCHASQDELPACWEVQHQPELAGVLQKSLGAVCTSCMNVILLVLRCCLCAFRSMLAFCSRVAQATLPSMHVPETLHHLFSDLHTPLVLTTQIPCHS